MEFNHKSVLLNETIDGLNIKPDGVYIDGTLGGGGHAFAVCSKLSKKGKFIGIDQDEDAIKAASERLEPFSDRVTVVRNNYRNITEIASAVGIRKADGILLDLGVSSYQLDTADRGFSYMENARLDMRMDNRANRSAYEVVNNYSESDLFRIIRDYGEERFARNIAKHIASERSMKPIETTGELARIIKESVPAKVRAKGGHPAKRTFQAIRIEVNSELEALSESLDDMAELLNDGGRICVITFHSLEDRIVKNTFKRWADPCTCPPDFPVCVCGNKPKGRIITGKPIVPGEEEVSSNRRAKSSKLRIFEKREQ